MKIAIIPVDLNLPIRFTEIDPENTLKEFQDIVGGYIEAADVPKSSGFPGLNFYVNEEFLLNGMEFNFRATAIYNNGHIHRGLEHGYIPPNTPLAGDVAVYGGIDEEGNSVELDEMQIEFLRFFNKATGFDTEEPLGFDIDEIEE